MNPVIMLRGLAGVPYEGVRFNLTMKMKLQFLCPQT